MASGKSSRNAPKNLAGLWWHPTGGYAKKCRGTTYYFGKDPEIAAKRFAAEWPYIQAGETPPAYSDGLRLVDLCNKFLTDREARVESGDLARQSFRDYHRTCRNILDVLGKNVLVSNLRPEQFGKLRRALSKTRGPVALANEMRRCKVMFNFAFDNFLIDQPVRYGTSFDAPSKKRIRQAENKRGPLLFTPDDVASVLAACKPHMRAMVLLALNGGFGNSDLARLPLNVVDLKSGWLDYARAKNAMPRRCPLWPETIDALAFSLKQRPEPKPGAANLFFVTRWGGDWAGEHDNVIAHEFRKVLDATGLHRPGLGFYSFRRTFRTYADEVGDDRAAGLIMGHADNSMAGKYVQRISDERLLAVTEHVRQRILGVQ